MRSQCAHASPSPQIESTLLLVRGEAKKKIPIMAEKRGVDMVVVGQRGLSKVKRCFLLLRCSVCGHINLTCSVMGLGCVNPGCMLAA